MVGGRGGTIPGGDLSFPEFRRTSDDLIETLKNIIMKMLEFLLAGVCGIRNTISK